MFCNQPLTDFTVKTEFYAFVSALSTIQNQIDNKKLKAFPIINGKAISSQDVHRSIDPSDYGTNLGEVVYAGLEEVNHALQSLRAGLSPWRATHFQQRAEILRKAAEIMRAQRYELAALIIREAGKPWKESDADVAEAIDFCEYYADEMLRLGPPKKMGDAMGEDNHYFYQPRGVAVVISPWNFPLAIACGMTVAALVTGNTVALKPAEQTSLIAARLAEILYQAGIPKNALAFLPGQGEVIGAALVESPLVDMICFTGSKAVGLDIISKAAVVHPNQRNIKKVVAEMGGKNAIIVDEDADLDEAIKGVLHSAFGYAGQKCSACSRVVAVGSAYDTFMNRMVKAAADLIIGPALESPTLVGPVIDSDTQQRILSLISEAEKQDSLAFKGQAPNSGYFVPPTIFKDVSETSTIWNEEIFGPVLACAKASNFNQALDMATNSQYALTGALFSRSPKNIEIAREDFRVGNFYINRGSTGALVYRQPFGGFCLSGVGSKAGGPDYLVQFMEPRTITENTMRRGFAPELIEN